MKNKNKSKVLRVNEEFYRIVKKIQRKSMLPATEITKKIAEALKEFAEPRIFKTKSKKK